MWLLQVRLRNGTLLLCFWTEGDMRRIGLLLLTSISLAACAEQIRIGTNQTRSTISEIVMDQAVSNAAAAWHDPLAIPAQVTLTGSLTSAVNTISAGIAPSIALRAIAITGINLGSTNAVTQNWTSDPIVN